MVETEKSEIVKNESTNAQANNNVFFRRNPDIVVDEAKVSDSKISDKTDSSEIIQARQSIVGCENESKVKTQAKKPSTPIPTSFIYSQVYPVCYKT